MEHQGIQQPHQNTDDQRHGNGQDHQRRGVGRSVRPGTSAPPTVLVADMGDEHLSLQGWKEGSSAFLNPADAVSLLRELTAAFGRTERTPSSDQGEAL